MRKQTPERDLGKMSPEQRELLERMNWAESGTLDRHDMSDSERQLVGALVRRGLVVRGNGWCEITWEGRRLIEPRALESLR